MTHPSQTAPGLYIHLPFCQSRCGYCDFSVYTDRDDRQAEYVEALEREMAFWSTQESRAFQSLYFGGGTPSRLEFSLWQRLLESLRKGFDLSAVSEVTVEANPESLSQELLDLWTAGGVTRISLGVQSFNDHDLKILDRAHDRKKAFEAIALLQQSTIKSWSVDLIYGLPHQERKGWMENLNAFLQTGAPHVSFYNLIQHPGLPVTQGMAGEDSQKRQEIDADLFLDTVHFLTRHGFEVYELSNAAQKGHACRHNLLYWCGGEWLGLGLSAWSCLEGRLFSNPASWQSYMETWRDIPDSIPVPVHQPAFESLLLDRIMLRLRLAEGVGIADLVDWVGEEAFHGTHALRQDLIHHGYLKADSRIIALTPEGWLVHSEIVTRLMQGFGF